MMHKNDSNPLKHISISHATVEAHLAIYAELPEDVRREVDAHLSACSDCMETWAAYQQQDQMVSDLMARRESIVARYGTARRMQGETTLEALRQRAQVQRLQPWWVAWPVRLRDFLRPMGAVTLATVATLVVMVALASFLSPSNWWDRVLTVLPPEARVTEDTSWGISEISPDVEIRAGIEAALARELAQWDTFSAVTLAGYVDMETSPAWRSRIREDMASISRSALPAQAEILLLREVEPDLALVGIRFYIPDLPADQQPIRSRFYRQIEGEWYWTEPKPAYWGKPLQIETAHFQLRFSELDTVAAGQTIAETLENAYVRLHETLGVIPEDRTIIIELHPSDPDHDMPDLEQLPPNYYRTFSPVFRAPILPNGEYDGHQFAATLLSEIMFIDWLFEIPLSWEVNGEPIRFRRDRLVLDIGFRTWLTAHSTETAPPFPVPETRFKEYVGLHTPLRLETLFLGNVSPEESMQLAFTLYAYAAERYGVEQAVALARAMYGGEDDWSVLIPEIFGLSQLVFETDWNVWLRAPELPGPPAESIAHDAVRQGIEDALARELAVWGSTASEDLAQYLDDDVSAAWWESQVRNIRQETSRFEAPPHRVWIDAIETSPLHSYSTQEPRSPAPVFVTLAFLYDDEQPTARRVGRIYRQVGERWYWTQPRPEYWGWGRILHTGNFRFEYRAMDWEPVEGVAEILERGHQCLAGLVGIEPMRIPMLDGLFGMRIITIRFIPDDALLLISPMGDNIYHTASPFFRAPRLAGTGHYDIEQYAGQLFSQMLATVYAEHLPFHYVGQPPILTDREWTAFQLGFQLWLTEYCTGVNYTLGMEDSAPSPAGRWVDAPSYQAFLVENHPFTLSDLESARPLVVSIQVAQQLFAYVAEKHGRAAAFAFAHALVGQEDDWAVIIPNILGISQAAFEADWNEWLETLLQPINRL